MVWYTQIPPCHQTLGLITNFVVGSATPIFTIYLEPIPWMSISLVMKGSVQW